ncbi:MAG: outer membrane beta-barrel protein [Hyphomicrobium sp.]
MDKLWIELKEPDVRIGRGAAFAILLIGATAAKADGIPTERRVVELSDFSGAYIGVNAGAAWGSSSYATSPGCVPPGVEGVFCEANSISSVNGLAVASTGTGDLTSSGFTGGIQGGYNWQFGRIVFGGEGDFGAFSLSKSANRAGVFPSPFLGTTYALNESMSTDWLITLRGRVGYTVLPHLLLYGTAGVALTDFRFSSSYADNAIDPLQSLTGGTGSTSISNVMTGWTIGGGGEWLLDSRWSIKAEYLYIDFRSASLPVALSNSATYTQTMWVDADITAQVARIGVNYRP